MRTTVLKPIAGSLAFSLLLSACTLAPRYPQPEVNVPANFRYDTAAKAAVPPTPAGKTTLPTRASNP